MKQKINKKVVIILLLLIAVCVLIGGIVAVHFLKKDVPPPKEPVGIGSIFEEKADELYGYSEDKDSDGDYIMLSDSGFKPEIHGFKFHNPVVSNISETSFGVCYGISTFTSLYYQQQLDTKVSNLDITEYELWFLRGLLKTSPLLILFTDSEDITLEYVPGFDIETIKKAGFNVSEDGEIIYDMNLGDWTSKTASAYQTAFNWSWESEYYEDYRYTDNAKEFIEAYNTIYEVHYDSNGTTISYPCLLVLNDVQTGVADLINNMNEDEAKTNALLQMLWYYQHQFTKDAKTHLYNFNHDREVILKTISAGIPLVLTTSDPAVTLCRIRQDIENPNLYYLDLYDSNHSGEPTTMTALIKTDSDGHSFVEYQYVKQTYTNITIHNVTVE